MNGSASRGAVAANAAVDLATAVRAAAGAAQACLVQGFPEQIERASVPLVRLEQEDAARLVTAARPKAVYLVAVAFDLEDALDEIAGTLADLGVDTDSASLKTTHRGVANRTGEICTTLVAFMVDGVLHTAIASAEWHDAFEAAVAETTNAAREAVESQGRAQTEAVKTEIAGKAALLAAHPSFNFSRVSFEKRLTLAEALFADCGDLDLREVTHVAENLFWLEQSGFTAPT